MRDLIEQAAELIQPFSADLAAAFLADPFRRVDLALAFANGFANDVTDDIHPTAQLVLRVAFADRDLRAQEVA